MNKTYSIGEISKKFNITVRSLQYYDQINLLNSKRNENNRRYYNDEDVEKLKKILFYKELGFNLENIKNLFLQNNSHIKNLFLEQQFELLQKMDNFHTSFLILDLLNDNLFSIYDNIVEILYKSIKQLPKDNFINIVTGVDFKFSNLESSNFTMESTMIFYHKWKEIIIKANILKELGKKPKDKELQNLAEMWWHTILDYTNNDINLIKKIGELDILNKLELDNKNLNETLELIGNALEIYLERVEY